MDQPLAERLRPQNLDEFLGQNKILGAIVCSSLVFFCIFGLYVLCNSETLMIDFYRLDLLEEARKLVLYYLGFVASYVCVVMLIFFAKYNKAVIYKRIFSKNLKKLLIRSRSGETEDDEDDD